MTLSVMFFLVTSSEIDGGGVLEFLSGGFQVKLCGAIQYLNLFGVAIGYTIASSISMM